MNILALDIGEKRIGVARGDSEVRIAIPVKTIEVSPGNQIPEILKLVKLYKTDLLVLGLPRNNSGAETAQSAYVRNFAENLKNAAPDLKITFEDETLTSVFAEERLKSRKKPYEKGEIDLESAVIILESYFDDHANL